MAAADSAASGTLFVYKTDEEIATYNIEREMEADDPTPRRKRPSSYEQIARYFNLAWLHDRAGLLLPVHTWEILEEVASPSVWLEQSIYYHFNLTDNTVNWRRSLVITLLQGVLLQVKYAGNKTTKQIINGDPGPGPLLPQMRVKQGVEFSIIKNGEKCCGTPEMVLGYWDEERRVMTELFLLISFAEKNFEDCCIDNVNTMGILYEHRRARGTIPLTAYGLATDGNVFQFMKIDHNANLSISRPLFINREIDRALILQYLFETVADSIMLSPRSGINLTGPEPTGEDVRTARRELLSFDVYADSDCDSRYSEDPMDTSE